MTPNIQKAVTLHPERAADYTWFDLEDLFELKEFEHSEVAKIIQQPMPFDKCGVAGTELDGIFFSLLITRGTEGEFEGALLVETALMYPEMKNKVIYGPPFWIRPELSVGDDLELSFVNSKDAAKDTAVGMYKVSSVLAAVFIDAVSKQDSQYPMYAPEPKSNNAKRLRQGKPPLFSWHTVLIEPTKQKFPHQGGTHATPRQHDVRGHWVNRNGKRFWRKPHKRGDASLGIVFHDYKIKPTVTEKNT
jgi:hypothetical protein